MKKLDIMKKFSEINGRTNVDKRTFSAVMRYDYVMTYTFHEKESDFRTIFLEKVKAMDPNCFGPGEEEFDQTTIAFNYNIVTPSVNVKLSEIVKQTLLEYRNTEGNRTAKYNKEDKLFLLKGVVNDNKICHIEVKDLSGILQEANEIE